MKKIHVLSVFFVIALMSCKKERLTNEKEIFIGSWKWIYAIRHGDYERKYYYTVDGTAQYRIEFLKRGLMYLYQDESIKDKRGCKFLNLDYYGTLNVANTFDTIYNSYMYVISIDNEKFKNSITGYINQDTLIVGFFSVNNYEIGIANDTAGYLNYFVRE